MGKPKKKSPKQHQPKNGLEERVAKLEEAVANIELSAQNALETLANGMASNLEQLWNNQKELSAAMSEMNENLVRAIEEKRNAEAEQSTRT